MVNKILRDGLAVLGRAENVHDLFNMIGRPDLADKTREKLLAHYPVYAELRSIADREFSRRLRASEPEETIDLGGGATARVIRKDRSKPTPLTSFLYLGRDRKFRHYHLRETKGWRGEVVDEFEVGMLAKQGVRRALSLPKGQAFRRARLRA